MSVTTRPLHDRDVPWALQLFQANRRDALSTDEQRASGFVQGGMDADRLRDRIAHDGALLAEVDGKPVGMVLAFAPGQVTSGPPALAEHTAREHGVTQFFLYGPAVVDASAPGHGVYRTLSAAMLEAQRGTYAHAIAFVEDDNQASMRAHERLGWRTVGAFQWQGRAYTVIQHDTASQEDVA